VRVRIGGTLAQPTLTLSGEDPNLSDSDLISYLVTGQPSFEVGTTQSVNTALSLASLTLNSYLEGRFSGGLFDYVQLQSAGATQAATANQTASNFLLNTSLGLGVQVGSRTFVSANLGLCGFRGLGGLGGTGTQFNPQDLANAAGGKVEYRLTPSVSAALGIEPASQSLTCGQTSSSRSFVPTPRQLGFDLFKTWRF
jgi:translocation and assembly module TamB